MKHDLQEFLDSPREEMLDIYIKNNGWDENDYEADREDVTYLLERIERGMESLGRYLKKQETTSIPTTQGEEFLTANPSGN